MLTVVVDMDGVIAVTREDNDYAKCEVMVGALEALTSLVKVNRVILYTARWEEDRDVTEKWLNENKLPYHKLVMGKPLGDVYLDDRALRFRDWKTSREELEWMRLRKISADHPMK